MKTNIRTLRKIARRLGFSVYQQGQQWILSHREETPLHYSVTTERAALLVGLGNADGYGSLTAEESKQVANA